MRFLPLIMPSDFIQVLNSAMKFYIKNEHFSNHNLFSTIYLLQKQILNFINYFIQALIMKFLYKLLRMVCTCMQKLRTF
jgi:hypothetical protein